MNEAQTLMNFGITSMHLISISEELYSILREHTSEH